MSTRAHHGLLLAGGGGGVSADPYFSNVVSLLHFEGANGSTTFTDQKGKTWTANGGAALSTAQTMWGAASLLCDGDGDYISAPASVDFSLTPSGDFTVEFWLYLTDKDNGDGNSVICVGNSAGYWQILVRQSGITINTRNSTGGAFNDIFASQTLTNGVWRHYAWTRESGTNRVFYNGTQLSTSGNIASALTQGNNNIYVGANYNGGTTSLAGYLDDVRITKGVARYTSNFTPPAAAFPDS